ncbi:MAG TPA: hypothetical protein VFQ60_02330 [Patescibacteria group bacterium]|nr:hypothetical protein [Patescibacteria group bacterium]
MSEFISSRILRWILIGLGALILLTGAFYAGIKTEERAERHFARWSENYGRLFGRMPRPGAPDFSGGHGVFGRIVSVSGSHIVVQGADEIEQEVEVSSSTAIRAGRSQASLGDLKPDMQAAVFGEPNAQGQIDARLIRILNSMPTSPLTGTTSTSANP